MRQKPGNRPWWITHIEEDKGKEPVSLGLRNDRVDITFQFDRKAGGEIFSILFPEPYNLS